MAAIHTSGRHMAVINGHKIAVYELGSTTRLSINSPGCGIEAKKGDGKDDGTDNILAAAFSPSGKYFAACDDLKRLTIWDAEASWQLVNKRLVPRRATALVFTATEPAYIIVADKSGDAHRFLVCCSAAGDTGAEVGGEGRQTEEGGMQAEPDSLVMGHVSMLLDLKLTKSDCLLVTADRDEKIRVSRYPDAYNVQAFCLGHTDYVSRLAYLEMEDLLLSGSGDGTLKLWDHNRGRLLHDVDCVPHLFLSATHSPELDLGSLSSVDPWPLHPRLCASAVAGGPEGGRNLCRGADVRCLVVAPGGDTVAVSVEGQPAILFYSLTSRSDCCGDASNGLTLRHRLLTAGTVCNLAFVDACHLLVLQQGDSSGVVAVPYRLEKKEPGLDVLPLTADTCTTGLFVLAGIINQDSHLLTACGAVSSGASKLHKVHIDNLKEYIARKNERMRSGAHHSTPAPGNKSSGVRKPKRKRKLDSVVN